MRKVIRYVLITIIVILLGVNLLLRFIDPLGIIRYWRDTQALFALSLPHETGYRFTPGHHNTGYFLTIGLDGLRVVPDTAPRTGCKIAVLGDSVAFGMGVNDSETVVNLLAIRNTDMHWSNAALPGYSAENVVYQLGNIPADGYIWLIIQNDNESARWYRPSQRRSTPSALSTYLLAFIQQDISIADTEPFTQYADTILAREDVLAFAFEDAYLSDIIAQRYPHVVIIPRWHSNISRFDPHPDAQGHLEIAGAILPYLPEFLERRCNA